MFWILFAIIIAQRLIELVIAKRNENWMRSKGAIEVGATHYPWMIILHTMFFISLLLEVQFLNRLLSPFWIVLFMIFLFTQLLRIWCLVSLGHFWNTKILVLPNVSVQKKGPYRWIRHPNYVVVATEIIIVPLLFSAYYTAVLFTLLNILMLAVRIPAEEAALKKYTNYQDMFD